MHSALERVYQGDTKIQWRDIYPVFGEGIELGKLPRGNKLSMQTRKMSQPGNMWTASIAYNGTEQI